MERLFWLVGILILASLVGCSNEGGQQPDSGAEIQGILASYSDSPNLKDAGQFLSEIYTRAFESPRSVDINQLVNALTCLSGIDSNRGSQLAERLEAAVFKGVQGLEKEIEMNRQFAGRIITPPTAEIACNGILRANGGENRAILKAFSSDNCSAKEGVLYMGIPHGTGYLSFGSPSEACAEWFETTRIAREDPECLTKCYTRLAPITQMCHHECHRMCVRGIKLYFGNGVLTTDSSAIKSANKLSSFVCEKVRDPKLSGLLLRKNGEEVASVAINHNEWFFTQAIQVMRQMLSDVEQRNFSFIGALYDLAHAPSWVVDFLQGVARALPSLSHLIDSDLKAQVEDYDHILELGHASLIVAHSQGNFYANEATRILQARYEKYAPENRDFSRHIGVIPVATPASSLPPTSLSTKKAYLSFFSDPIVLFTPGALAPNTRKDPAGLFDHYFQSYLEGSPSRSDLEDSLFDLISRLRYPSSELLDERGGV